MDAEMAAGFVVVVACLLAILILVFASRGQIEKIHRQGSHQRPKTGRGGEKNGHRGDPR